MSHIKYYGELEDEFDWTETEDDLRHLIDSVVDDMLIEDDEEECPEQQKKS